MSLHLELTLTCLPEIAKESHFALLRVEASQKECDSRILASSHERKATTRRDNQDGLRQVGCVHIIIISLFQCLFMLPSLASS